MNGSPGSDGVSPRLSARRGTAKARGGSAGERPDTHFRVNLANRRVSGHTTFTDRIVRATFAIVAAKLL